MLHEDIILLLLNTTDKLILTGSTSLCLVGVMGQRGSSDIDLCLTSPLTVDELSHIKDFLGLDYREPVEYRGDFTWENTAKDTESILKQGIIQLVKQSPDWPVYDYKIDIFNDFFIKEEDVRLFEYKGQKIPISLPHISLMKKAKYAFDYRSSRSSQEKHLNDLKRIIDDKNMANYFETINKLESRSS